MRRWFLGFAFLVGLALLGRFSSPSPLWLPDERTSALSTLKTTATTQSGASSLTESATVPKVLGTKTRAVTAASLLLGLETSVNAGVSSPQPITALERMSSKSGEDSMLVTHVIDGDTIELESSERVRYIGMDTPEDTTEHECYGPEATARNRALVERKTVRLVPDVGDRDKYHRLLRYVYVGDQFINLRLVAEGYASTLAIPPDTAHAAEFSAAEALAKSGRLGLWARCGGNPPNYAAPGPSHSDSALIIPQATTTDCPNDKPIKGNAQSKIYHVPGGDFYQKTKPEVCFATEQDAVAAGYRKSKR